MPSSTVVWSSFVNGTSRLWMSEWPSPHADAVARRPDHPDLAAMALQEADRLLERLDEHLATGRGATSSCGRHDRQRALRLHAVCQLVGVPAQLDGEPGVGDRDGTLVGEALEQRQLVIAEPVRRSNETAACRSPPLRARSGAAAMPRSASRSATAWSPGSCGMRGSTR